MAPKSEALLDKHAPDVSWSPPVVAVAHVPPSAIPAWKRTGQEGANCLAPSLLMGLLVFDQLTWVGCSAVTAVAGDGVM